MAATARSPRRLRRPADSGACRTGPARSTVVPAPPAPPQRVLVARDNPPAPVAAAAIVSSGYAVRCASVVLRCRGSTAPSSAIKRPTSGPASRFEWRTPPLWGFRDSAPYLHDGRAKTLDQAVAMHGGESTRVAQGFFNLTAKERRQLEAFLKSLTAPTPAELVASNGN